MVSDRNGARVRTLCADQRSRSSVEGRSAAIPAEPAILGEGRFDRQTGRIVRGRAGLGTPGLTRRMEMGFAAPVTTFLPLKHTALDTGSSRSISRHFIELCQWQPSTRTGPPWKLQWQVFEVVRDQIIKIDTSEPGATSPADAPPSGGTFDVREYAVLRVDQDRNAEWAVTKGPQARTQRIESDAERREIRDEALAQQYGAEELAIGSAEYDVNRRPAMSYVGAHGCGQIEVYGGRLTPSKPWWCAPTPRRSVSRRRRPRSISRDPRTSPSRPMSTPMPSAVSTSVRT